MDTSFITINTHSSIRLENKRGTVIYVDPYGFETEPHDADLILVTHSHFDHLSPEDIARVRKPHTAFVLPATCMGAFIKAGFTNERAAFIAPRSSLYCSAGAPRAYFHAPSAPEKAAQTPPGSP